MLLSFALYLFLVWNKINYTSLKMCVGIKRMVSAFVEQFPFGYVIVRSVFILPVGLTKKSDSACRPDADADLSANSGPGRNLYTEVTREEEQFRVSKGSLLLAYIYQSLSFNL
jgi:hypothetical protein